MQELQRDMHAKVWSMVQEQPRKLHRLLLLLLLKQEIREQRLPTQEQKKKNAEHENSHGVQLRFHRCLLQDPKDRSNTNEAQRTNRREEGFVYLAAAEEREREGLFEEMEEQRWCQWLCYVNTTYLYLYMQLYGLCSFYLFWQIAWTFFFLLYST